MAMATVPQLPWNQQSLREHSPTISWTGHPVVRFSVRSTVSNSTTTNIEVDENPSENNGPVLLRIQKPRKITGSVSDIYEDAYSETRSNQSWADPRTADFKYEVLKSTVEEKKTAIVDLVERLEAQNVYDLSDLHDEEKLTKAVNAIDNMEWHWIRILTDSFCHLLKICIRDNHREEGQSLCDLAIRSGLSSDPFLACHLIRMFTYFDDLQAARKIFRALTKPNLFCWHSIIVAHQKLGVFEQVMNLYHEMCGSNISPNSHVLLPVLKACCVQEELEVGMEVHSQIVKCGYESDVFLGSMLIDMYSKCSNLEEAVTVFHELPDQNVVTWTALITGHCIQDQPANALELFNEMQKNDIKPNAVTFIAAMKACTSCGAVEVGKIIHSQVVESEFDSDIMVASAVVDMYAKCGLLDDADAVFGRMKKQDIIACNSLISGYAQHGQCEEASKLFWSFLNKGIAPDNISLATVLQLCPSIVAIEQGKAAHQKVIECGFEADLPVGSSLVSMYCKCGDLENARITFQQLPRRSILTWNAIILGCAQNHCYSMALDYYQDMLDIGMKPNGLIFLSLISACNNAGLIEESSYYMKLMRDLDDVFITVEHYNTLVDLYGRLGLFEIAEDLLETLPHQFNSEGWMLLLGACNNHDIVDLGRRCFDYIYKESIPDYAFTMMSHIYIRASLQDKLEELKELKKIAGLQMDYSKSFIEIENQIHTFTNCGSKHVQESKLLAKLNDLGCIKTKKDAMKNVLCGRSDLLAVAFGLVNTPSGTTIRISRNRPICAESHNAIKTISKVETRKIVVCDPYRIHHFHRGTCCCKDLL